MPHPLQHHTLTIVILRPSPTPALHLNHNPVRNPVPLTKLLDLPSIQMFQILKQFPLLLFTQPRNKPSHKPGLSVLSLGPFLFSSIDFLSDLPPNRTCSS